MKLTKTDFIDLMATKCECKKADAKYWVEAVFDGLTACLADKNDVFIPGFGTFTYRNKPEKTARNPRTNEPVVVPAHGVVGFKATKGLKDAVR